MNVAPRPDRYDLLSVLETGGMGTVWIARDRLLQREVALKIVPGGAGDDPLREARLTAQIDHPGVVPVHDAGVEADGTAWYVMRLVRGSTLRALLAARREPARAALLRVLSQVAQVVGFAHQRGVVHRDLKPENVIVGAFGVVYLLDWGLALGAGLTPAGGARAGTPGYLAPEQRAGQADALGPPTDVWALGAMLLEIVDPQAFREGGAGGPLSPVAASEPELAALLADALQEDPRARPREGGAFAERLLAHLEGDARRAQAEAELHEARRLLAAHETAEEDTARLSEELARLDAATPVWAPWAARQALHAAQNALAAHARDQARRRDAALVAAERSATLHPGSTAARELAADLWWRRGVAEERAGNPDAADVSLARAAAWSPRHLEHAVAVQVETVPPGAEVRVAAWRAEGPLLELGPERVIGLAPVACSLPRGRWRVACDGASVSLRLRPDDPPRQVQLVRGRAIPGLCYVAGGRFVPGGDPGAGFQLPARPQDIAPFYLGERLVTFADWLAFLAALSPAEARRRVPRSDLGGAQRAMPLLVEEEGRWRLPQVDAEGDPWHPAFPVFGVDWDDARAYAAWRAETTGVPYRLPTELEWEFAARSADERIFPWGDGFDAALCRTAASAPGRPQPCPVGRAPLDRSPYGVLDMAGLVREWCGDSAYDGDPTRRPVRGGCWNGSDRICRAANRYGYTPSRTDPSLGFRLAASIGGEAEGQAQAGLVAP